MIMYVGVTDYDWYKTLKSEACQEVNFWKPGGNTNFNAININDLFLFKLHSPNNYIVGGGYFVRFSILPTFLAWEAFGIENGTNSLKDLNNSIQKYKNRNRIKDETLNTAIRYGREQLVKPRLGQGAFRIVVTEAYHRRCSITGEKTLPVLDAAHIKPFSEAGPNSIQNGLLLRTDIHTLFDKGYITIDDKYNIDVSKRLKDDFGNGKMYYEYHGKQLLIMPDNTIDLPSKEFLHWHNEKVFLR